MPQSKALVLRGVPGIYFHGLVATELEIILQPYQVIWLIPFVQIEHLSGQI